MRILDKILIVMLIVAAFSAVTVSAQPAGVTNITIEDSSSYNASAAPTAINAIAGNVTQLSLNATGVTTSWQGYYGNISGQLVLADSSGNNFYDWNLSSPAGEVYASRDNSITWSTVNCSNSSQITAEETYLGQSATDPDSVTNTFASTSHPDFYLGSVNVSGCQSTQAYDSTGGPGTGFWQVLLSDSGDDATIYTTLIDEVIQTGFNNLDWHFQLLVGENGKNGDTSTTPYYFYVELE